MPPSLFFCTDVYFMHLAVYLITWLYDVVSNPGLVELQLGFHHLTFCTPRLSYIYLGVTIEYGTMVSV
jgi:hypothetical protein